ncbi:hypothetical protein [Bartonella machadoae]|uniref:hypothetical protein n=1 Tax=Bartonella machadoae TaxID=2893471 RepID=UPI001F4D1FEB|nr:hypothetical protein [Bartonella machadoae]UNE53946.1 hypothetical protein LNM86_10240 [Bartonella machadoae]
MKLLSITRAVAFITFFSLSMLYTSMSFGFMHIFTSVDDIEKYNKLYQEYAEQYKAFEHFEKQEKARQFIYSRGHQDSSPKFDLIWHRHILVILCGRLVNLLRGDYNEEMSWANLPNVISSLRYEYGWSEGDFIWAYNMSMDSKDRMIYYAKKFLNSSSGNGISPETQMIDVVAGVNAAIRTGNPEPGQRTARLCRDLKTIYNIMEPR